MRYNDNMVKVMLNSRGDRPFHSVDEVSAGIPTITRWSPMKFLFLDFQYPPSRNITAWAGVRAGPAFSAEAKAAFQGWSFPVV
ncbi:MAG TPA: hypothetical protein VLM75_12815 [Spirochaetota bacterium]|nr:hypothetical protein [Spirochaetota bacterium]